MGKLIGVSAAAMAALLSTAAPAQQSGADDEAASRAAALRESLHPRSGDVRIEEASAVLHLGQAYYFLPASDAKRVIVEGWGNPPEAAEQVLGMVFRTGTDFSDESWGAVLSFDPIGYVSDKDAASADYDAMLAEMRSGEEELNARRREQGYPAGHLVGWAQQPVYDRQSHSVVWAQNIAFEGAPENTLNYDLRMLNRRGVLSMNLVTGMAQLEQSRAAAAGLARSAEFDIGSRYADFIPGSDHEAGIGVAGLVAAGVGAAAVKKLGLLAIVLAFAKKFFVLIAAGFAALAVKLRRLFGGGGAGDGEGPDSNGPGEGMPT